MAQKPKTSLRLACYARWLLQFAAASAYLGMKMPHKWVVAVTNRSWRMSTDGGPWVAIRIDNTGRILK